MVTVTAVAFIKLQHPRSLRLALLIGCIGFGAGLLAYLPPPHFPYTYQNDEPSKVEQIQGGYRNLRHPVLMLTIVDALTRLSNTTDQGQRIADIGRTLSAVSVAFAIGALAFCLTASIGLWSGLAAIAMALVQPLLYETTCYFKEDGLHIATLTLCAAAFTIVSRWQRSFESPQAGFLIGLAAGLALSARYYVWVVALVVVVFLLATRRATWLNTGLPSVVALGLFAALHVPWLMQPTSTPGEVAREVSWLLHGHYHVGYTVPHNLYVRQYLESSAPLYAGLLLAGILVWWQSKIRPALAAIVLVCMYVAFLSFSSKYAERYFLPILLVLIAAQASGWSAIMNLLQSAFPKTKTLASFAAALLVALPIYVQNREVSQLKQLFARDSRQELARWIENNLPPDVQIAEDSQAQLRNWHPALVTRHAHFVTDLGSPEEMIAAGFTHIIMCYDRHHRYTGVGRRILDPQDKESAARKERYLRLLNDFPMIWQSESVNPKALHPGLQVVALKPENKLD
ncbi:MAG: glycosyltransferase family 39 protein [Verrucomicrobiia bacterium]